MYAAPKSWIGRREIRPAPVSAVVADAYAVRVRELAADPPQGTLILGDNAARLFHDWQAEVEAMLADGGDLEAIRDWGGKLAGATARLAAVLHCAKHREAMRWGIESDTIRAAVEIGRYLIPHAEAVLTMMQANDDTTADDARYVLQWIIRHGRREFTKREAQQHGKRRFRKADDIDPALAELARRGYIRPKPQDASGPGRPPSPAYEVNPAVFDSENAEKCSHNSQKSNSEIIENAFGHSETTNRERVSIMVTAELLAECQARNIILQAHGGRLDVDAPAGALTAELLQRLRDTKGELVAMLASGPVGGALGGADPVTNTPTVGPPQDGRPSVMREWDPTDAAEWQEYIGSDSRRCLVRCDAAEIEIIDAEPCPICSGLERWQDLAGGWHCERCEPRTRATWLREHAQRLRERHSRNPRQ